MDNNSASVPLTVCAKVEMTASSVDIALFAPLVGLVFFVILIMAACLVFTERRILAWVQDRKGPNRFGPPGLMQPPADLIKLLTNEGSFPAATDKRLLYRTPALASISAVMIFAVMLSGALQNPDGHTVPLPGGIRGLAQLISHDSSTCLLPVPIIMLLRWCHYQQLHLVWKVLTPLALLNTLITVWWHEYMIMPLRFGIVRLQYKTSKICL